MIPDKSMTSRFVANQLKKWNCHYRDRKSYGGLGVEGSTAGAHFDLIQFVTPI